MSESDHMIDKHAATASDAVNLLKRTFRKVSKDAASRLIISIPRDSMPKLARAIDPSGNLYPNPFGDIIYFNGVAIVAEESGEDGRRQAYDQLSKWAGCVA